MKNFKTKTMTTPMTTPKKILAGATAVVALSGFVPAINAASPTANTNVGVSVVIQQAITIAVGGAVNFGVLVLSAATVAGTINVNTAGAYATANLASEVFNGGGQGVATMAINASAGDIRISVGAATGTTPSSKITFPNLIFGNAIAAPVEIAGGATATVLLTGGSFNIGGEMKIISKPVIGSYSATFGITVTDI